VQKDHKKDGTELNESAEVTNQGALQKPEVLKAKKGLTKITDSFARLKSIKGNNDFTSESQLVFLRFNIRHLPFVKLIFKPLKF
jgi:hypothetical protein